MPSTAQLLQEGIAAAKAGQRANARDLLTHVTELAPNNAVAWLWRSNVADTLPERVRCLEQAIALEPANARIGQTLEEARQQLAEEWLHEGIAAVEAEEPDRARELLMRVVARDDATADAWWWLSQVVEAPNDREICLENVLTLTPDHIAAREMLIGIQRDRALQEMYGTASPTATAPAIPVSTATDAARDDMAGFSARAEPDPLHNELSCPYCTALTVFEDQQCPACGRTLWIREREAEDRSNLYWILVALEIAFMLAGTLLPLILLTYLGIRLNIDDIFQFVPIYLGRANLPEIEAALIFGLVPRSLFWLSLVPTGLSLLIVLGILSRWLPLYLLASALGGIRMVVGIGSLAIALSGGLEPAVLDPIGAAFVRPSNTFIDLIRTAIFASDVLVVALSALALVLLLRLHDHFAFTAHRVLLRIDDDVEGSDVGLWLRGREYAQQQMWAIAALHLRSSLGIEKRSEAFLALAVTYIHLQMWELAEKVLHDARAYNPDNSQIDDFARLLSQKRAEEEHDAATI